MPNRTGAIGVYGGNAGRGMGSSLVQPPVGGPDVLSVVKDYIDTSHKEALTRDGIRSVRAETKFQIEALKHQDSLDPMSPSYLQDLNQWAEENRPTMLADAGFETDEAKRDFEQRAVQFTGGLNIDAVKRQRVATTELAKTTREDAQNEALNNIRNDPANSESYLSAFQSQAARVNAGLPPELRAKMDRQFADEAVLTQAEGIAMGGDIKGARDFLKGATGVAPDSVRAMGRRINEIENQNDQVRSQELTGQYADALEGVYSGRFTSPGQLDRPEYAELWKERPTARVELRQRLRNEQERKVNEARARAVAARKAALGEGTGYTQHDGDLAWAGTMLDHPPATTKDYVGALFTHIRAYTTVPTLVKQGLAQADLSGDPEELAANADLEEAIRTRFPAASTGAGKIYSEIATFKKDYNMTTDQAVAAALKQRNADPNFIKGNQEEQAQTLKDAKYLPRASLAEDFGAEAGQISSDMVYQYDTVVKDQMSRNGNNLALARKVATAEVRNKYLPGPSTVGGVEQVVPFSPEAQIAQSIPNAKAYLPMLGDALTAHLKEMLTDRVRPYAPAGEDPWGVVDGLAPFRLYATKDTENAIRAGGRPEYEIQWRTVGGFTPVRDANGDVVTYALPTWDDLKTYPGIREKLAADMQRVQTMRAPTRPPQTDPGALMQEYGAP